MFLIVYEPIILLAIYWFLKQRGWQFNDLKLQPSLQSSGYGIILAACAYISFVAVWIIASFISPEFVRTISQTNLVGKNISLLNIVAVSIINPFFEELLIVGYVITLIRQVKGETYAVNISVAIRMLYHLYQGPVGVMAIIPFGLICAYWYARKGKLWSVIVAHALFDFFGLYSHQ